MTSHPTDMASGPRAEQAAGVGCLSSDKAYDLALEREVQAMPRTQRVSAAGIEEFARAIAPLAAARHWARRAASGCVTPAAIVGGISVESDRDAPAPSVVVTLP